MAENLFILGAGASFDAGAPLMNGFFDRAYEMLGNKEVAQYQNAFQDVFSLLKELRLVYANSLLDLNNIESLFGAIEMGLIINLLGHRTDDDIQRVRKALVRLIVTTLEKSMEFKIADGLQPTKSYSTLVKLIQEKMKSSTIITFNYDIALDYAMYHNGLGFDYCTGEGHANGNTKLLKLHGSLNWALCRNCGMILPLTFESRNYNRLFPSTRERGSVHLQFDEYIRRHEHRDCTNGISGCDELPVIVPPTWNKKDYHGNLTNVWKHAAKELQETRNIYVIGYSLPESDAFFRYLFALGTFDNANIKRFWVFNPDDSPATRARYSDLIGKGISSRFDFKKETFEQALVTLSKEVK